MYVLLEYYGKTRRVLHHGVSDCCTFLVVCSLSVLRSTHLIPCLNIKHQEIFVQPFFLHTWFSSLGQIQCRLFARVCLKGLV